MPTRREFLQVAATGIFVAVAPGLYGESNDLGAQAGTTRLPYDPKSLVRPVKIVKTVGDVRNAEALITKGVATLTMTAGGTAPQIILDYGHEVGGNPIFEITKVSGAPVLKAIYSEALPWLLPSGDGPAPGTPATNDAATSDISFVGIAGGIDLSRVERFPLQGVGRLENRLLQAGLRFQAVGLASPGVVELRLVGLIPSFHIPTPSENTGAFRCSEPALNEIWAMGPSTLNAASVPVHSVPAIWDVTSEGIKVGGSAYAGYRPGANWKDYTAAFDTKILANEASWLVRASQPNGLRMVLCASDDQLPISKPNTLRVYIQFTKKLLAEVPLPTKLSAGGWHRVETEVIGSSAKISLDGTLLTTVTLPPPSGFRLFASVTSGWVAFGNAQGAEAVFRNLKVTAPDGKTLYESSLTDPELLYLFCANSNELPSIVDGAKRDRLLFTGDLGVATLSLLSSTWALDYLSGSIRLFSAFQNPDGSILTALPTQSVPGKTPPVPSRGGISDYTVHHVSSTYNYWLHTGDGGFLSEQWPVVTRVLAYLSSMRNAQGLVAQRSIAETLTNAHYYGALKMASHMAEALEKKQAAAQYEAAAQPLRDAINAHLFNADMGLYGMDTGHMSVAPQHGNAYAVLYGVAPADRVPSILQKLQVALANPAGPLQASSGSTRIGPYTAGYEILARFSAGDTEGAIAIVRKVWDYMRSQSAYATGTAWEYVGLDGTPGLGPGTSLSHPWSTMPTPALSKYVLGIRPVEPGYRKWLVEPQLANLDWAEGKVPTPSGPLHVRWQKKNGHLSIRIEAPQNTKGIVGFPRSTSTVRINNRTVPTSQTVSGISRRPGYVYVEGESSGLYEQFE